MRVLNVARCSQHALWPGDKWYLVCGASAAGRSAIAPVETKPKKVNNDYFGCFRSIRSFPAALATNFETTFFSFA